MLKHYRERFRYLLVDEFQDTNSIQYAWLRVLAGDHDNLFVVGDDDQSIYGWRGAKIENIQKFSQDFPNSELIRLEQNYRSTTTILNAANGLINQNSGRLGKELWTDQGKGDPISLYTGFNEIDEARYIVSRIKDWTAQGNNYSESAILSIKMPSPACLKKHCCDLRSLTGFMGDKDSSSEPEIRNVLAYMRLISQQDLDAAFERVVNTPTRGIGDKSLQEIRFACAGKQYSVSGRPPVCSSTHLI